MFVVKCHASVVYKVDWCEHVTRLIFSRLKVVSIIILLVLLVIVLQLRCNITIPR